MGREGERDREIGREEGGRAGRGRAGGPRRGSCRPIPPTVAPRRSSRSSAAVAVAQASRARPVSARGLGRCSRVDRDPVPFCSGMTRARVNSA